MKAKADPEQEPKADPKGYPNGAFLRDGRWLPGEATEGLVAAVVRDLIWVRRHNDLSPMEYLLRLKNYKYADLAAGMLGTRTIQAMAGLEDKTDWSRIPDAILTDLGCWVVHCGSPYRDHHWRGTGHWVPNKSQPVWEGR